MPYSALRKAYFNSRKRKRRYGAYKARKKAKMIRRSRYKARRPYRAKKYSLRRRGVFSKRQKAYLNAAMRNSGDQDNVQIYRTLKSGQLSTGTNEKKYNSFPFLVRSQIDEAVGTYHAATQTGNGITQMTLGSTLHTGAQDDNKNLKVKVLSGYFEMKLRNNCTTPVELCFYHLSVKRRMSIADDPISEITDGLANSGAGSGSIQDLRFSPYDSPTFLRHYKVLRTSKVVLKVGQEHKYTMRRIKPFTYSSADKVNHTASHQDPLFTQWLLIDMRGCIAHSLGTPTVGVSPSSCDYTVMRQIKFANSPSKMKTRYLTSGDYLPALPTNPIHRQLVTEIQEHTCGIPSLEQVVTATAGPALVAFNATTSSLDSVKDKLDTIIENCCDSDNDETPEDDEKKAQPLVTKP